MSSEWVQECIFCGGSGIDPESFHSGVYDDNYMEPPYLEPCICQYTHWCSCGFGEAFNSDCAIWCGHGHYNGKCPPLYATLTLFGEE